MAQMIEVIIDESTAQVTVDLKGFHGQGCDAVMQAMMQVGNGESTQVTKPEYRAQAQIGKQAVSAKQ